MIKIDQILVKNYKNIGQAELNLRNINVIVGENNIGKTNFLESISFLNHVINGTATEVELGMTGGYFGHYGHVLCLEESNYGNPFQISLLFSSLERNLVFSYSIDIEKKDSDTRSSRSLRISKEQLSYKEKGKTGSLKSIFSRTDNDVRYNDEIRKEGPKKLQDHVSTVRLLNLLLSTNESDNQLKIALSGLNEILSTPTFYFSNHLLRSREIKFENTTRIARFDLNEEVANIQSGSLSEEFQSAVNQVLGFTSVELYIPQSEKAPNDVPPRKYAYVVDKGRAKFVTELSDGSIVLLALLVKIFSHKSDIFFIEEPENSIHPKALYELMQVLFRYSDNKQFVITSHSSYLLNMIRPDDVFVASKDVENVGMTKIEKLPNQREIKRKLSRGFISFGELVFMESEVEDDED